MSQVKYKTNLPQEQSKSNVILIELVIVILFFALTAATAMQMFVGSHQKSEESKYIQAASVYAQDLAERLAGEYDPESYLLENGFMERFGFYRLVREQYLIQVEIGQEKTSVGTLHEYDISVYDMHYVDESSAIMVDPLTRLEQATYEPDLEVAI